MRQHRDRDLFIWKTIREPQEGTDTDTETETVRQTLRQSDKITKQFSKHN